jgi:spermidine/putrescine transport system permease protein
MERKRLSPVVFGLTMLFFYLPLVLMMLFSFNEAKTMIWQAFSFRWYEELFMNSDMLWRAFGFSVLIAVASSTLACALGTAGAVALHWYDFRGRRYLKFVTYLPLIIPDIIMGVSLLIFFAAVHFNLGLQTIFIAHTTFSVPFVLFILLARLEEFDDSVIEASRDLGAGEFYTLRRVIIPMLLPGIISGFLMSMTLSLDDFVITFFVSGPGSSTLPLHIYSMLRFGVSPVINALSVIMIAVTVLLTLMSKNVQKYMIGRQKA